MPSSGEATWDIHAVPGTSIVVSESSAYREWTILGAEGEIPQMIHS
jgi:hypothetical protein